MPDATITGPALNALRQELGLSQEAMADVLDTSQPQISRWEKGRPPSDLQLHARAARLHVYWKEAREVARWQALRWHRQRFTLSPKEPQ